MQPEKAQSIIDKLHNPNGPLGNKNEQHRTAITEVGRDGSMVTYRDGNRALNTTDNTTPGDFVVVRTENVSNMSHHLSAIGSLGYLVTDKPDFIDPGNTDPHLQLISHSNPDMGTLTEAVFRDHNPQR